ncbi:flagellar filament capping protein FliD [Sulfurimonas sp. SAG-AH-194-I05]|nr:flagellar filament capping protein FliD [Sulfurimonas sp. SAG-AH-194-I05]MDF1876158.1 flagellar filament capping protein FliD [Sulfurimonas sp. SAG-AH-194-I05]
MGVSSLGIGSGVLTADLLDKLRDADNAAILAPLEKKIELSSQKDEARELLNGFMTTFKSSSASIGGENLYQSRTIAGNDDFITVTAKSGSDLQSFNIENVVKAEKNVWNATTSIADKDVAIAGLGTGTLTIEIDGTSLDIDYNAATTLNDIRGAINDGLGSKVTATNLQTGDSAFSLSMSADEFNQAITITDSGAAGANIKELLGLSEIQVAKPSTFDFNGVTITRSTNTIDDLVNGVTITLNKSHSATDSSSITVGQDTEAIKTDMELFVTNYNLLASNLKDMTVYNAETDVAGIFNSEPFLKSIISDLKSILTSTDSKGNSLFDYGLDIARDGTMSLDNSNFSAKLTSDPKALELLFRGSSETFNNDGTSANAAVDGIVKRLDDKMSSLTGRGKLLDNFTAKLTSSKDNLISEYDKQKASLDSRYEILTKKFTSYDAVISRLNNQFSSLKLLIDAESNN